MALFLPQRWSRQPQYSTTANKGTALSNKLLSLNNLYSIAQCNAISGERNIPTAGVVSSINPMGRGASIAGASDAIALSTALKIGSGGFSALSIAVAVADSTKRIAGYQGGTDGGFSWGLSAFSDNNQFFVQKTGVVTIQSGIVASAGHLCGFLFTFQASDAHVFVYVYNYTTRTYTEYLSSANADSPASSDNRSKIGNDYNVGNGWGNAILLDARWQRTLQKHEILSCFDNPWQLFAPLPTLRYFFTAGAAPTATGQFFHSLLNNQAWF
jgi:hypothetical protein